ncbi:hypothetical protein [Thalassococcus sp. S3]|uniref:hypothetical protein n=1 Tax=Thalassococcus sp. S3 TaxID=2017482 RepID=UPI0010241AA3|nr:hypothetical protein [Thalassococcus sp. S3]QBF31351.1 hypothetical protein CFI11_08980 [Thalassococcus sp. S3]
MIRIAAISLCVLGFVLALKGPASAWMRGEVFYIAMGETCPWGWTNRSGDAALMAAYGPSAEMADHDMCIGGF